ncbi:MarR family transcriptional regulator [Rhizobium sp. SSA_523]|uniref:MarR family winged helix-turn-helix transcriptional regulator n=1 Tax=Rhizobium sp. SSA_523 TaxID=2952477 RepID=UPI00209115FA|nr:MarR family transcriptional regulator [Rhizobium sp. SSA_523]MCO5732264.1 MarR family transcriptional regulator [Rhizobium sp. SSA_523]WKC22515.1 MarR family transcriptional regulator [Rhizobium sp. SSA_523]
MTEPEPTLIDIEIITHGLEAKSKPETRLWLRMLSTTKLVSSEIRKRLRAEFGATLPQFDLMAQLYRENAGLRLGELSRRTMVTNGNVTGLVERLEAEGLVVRETPTADRRVTVARLTEHGNAVFAEMAKAHESWLRELMSDVEPGHIITLLDEIGHVKRSVANHVSGAEGE